MSTIKTKVITSYKSFISQFMNFGILKRFKASDNNYLA